jgi:glutathione S-transferase
VPTILNYFGQILERNGSCVLGGKAVFYVDLSLFQMIEGLRYAFPHAMSKSERKHRRMVALRDRVAARPPLAAYLASERRLSFNQEGIFRHYAELDDRS